MTRSRLEEIEARLRAATPGPWELDEPTRKRWGVTAHNIVNSEGREVVHADDYYLDGSEENLALICHAPSDIAFLSEALREMEHKVTWNANAAEAACRRANAFEDKLKVATEALDIIADNDAADGRPFAIAREALARIKETNT